MDCTAKRDEEKESKVKAHSSTADDPPLERVDGGKAQPRVRAREKATPAT
jgi:hypothetical protein